MAEGYWAGLLVALPLMANRVLQALGWSVFYLADPAWQWVLCTVVQGLAGWPHYVGAVRGRGGHLAVVLPSLILYVYSAGESLLLLRGGRELPVLFDLSAAALLLGGALLAGWHRRRRKADAVFSRK
ncbi:MAG TPA: hypothetical protein VIL07_02285 [Symbiobacteriaceae bacterium]